MKLFTHLSILCLCSFGCNAHGFFGITQAEKCDAAFSKVKLEPTNQDFIRACLTDCQYSSYSPAVHRDYNRLKAGYDFCANRSVAGAGAAPTGAPTGSAARCDAAAALLTSTAPQDTSVWEACVVDCDAAVADATQDTLKQRYSGTSAGCGEKLGPTTPQDPITDEGDTVAEDAAGDTGGSTTGDLPVADTGSTNTNALNNALSGLGANSSSLRPIDPGRGVNFLGSGGGSRGSYGEVSQGVGALVPQGGDVLPPQRYDDVVSGAAEGPKADAATFAGGAPGGSGGGGGVGGGSGGGGSRPAAGGGARTSAAAAQLAKQGNNQFWAGGSGGGTPAGKAAARTTATALKVPLVEKPKFGPEYLNKGTGSDGLLRLWGAGMNRLPVDRGSQSCRDQTIFCNLENFDFEFKP
jgi:hypothetical protein